MDYAQDIHFTLMPKIQETIGARVQGMTQDSNGYLWLASNHGLYKYNGFSLIVFHNIHSDLSSLIDEDVECVMATERVIFG